ncbi:AAA domain-containing protein [Phycomyces blakesleeanus]
MVHQTGKTYTLVEIIRQLAIKENKKVLVCGPSNISVDNLVERLARHRMNLVRVGHPARILPTVLEHSLDIITKTCDSGQIVADVRREMDETLAKISKSKNRSERRILYGLLKDLRKDYKVRERKVVDEVMSGAEVLISTLNGCGSRNMFKREFDVVIIDEATQALEAECWIALSKGKKAILVRLAIK